jgi:hypothetical protein
MSSASAENVLASFFPNHDGIIGRLSWEEIERRTARKEHGAVVAAALFHSEETGVRGRGVLVCGEEAAERYLVLPRHLLAKRKAEGPVVALRIARPNLNWWAEATLPTDSLSEPEDSRQGLRDDLVAFRVDLAGTPCLRAHAALPPGGAPALPMRAVFAGRQKGRPLHAQQLIYRMEPAHPLSTRLWKADLDASPGLSGTPIIAEDKENRAVFGILVAMQKTPSCAHFDKDSCYSHIVALRQGDLARAERLEMTVHEGEGARQAFGRKKGRNL